MLALLLYCNDLNQPYFSNVAFLKGQTLRRMNNLTIGVKSTFEPRLLELVSLRIGQINDCTYCINIHHRELLDLGESELRLALLYVWESVPHFSKKEKAVLGLVKEICDQNRISPTNKTLQQLQVYFGDYHIDKLVASIKTMHRWSWFMKTFGYDYKIF